MSTQNIGFYEDLTKIITYLSSNTHLISSAVDGYSSNIFGVKKMRTFMVVENYLLSIIHQSFMNRLQCLCPRLSLGADFLLPLGGPSGGTGHKVLVVVV